MNNDGDLVVVGLDLGLVYIGIRILVGVIGFNCNLRYYIYISLR